jgi:hypothetical protein
MNARIPVEKSPSKGTIDYLMDETDAIIAALRALPKQEEGDGL